MGRRVRHPALGAPPNRSERVTGSSADAKDDPVPAAEKDF